ncbi:TlpA family protein disulfide reductase [Singulisphaera rosea]
MRAIVVSVLLVGGLGGREGDKAADGLTVREQYQAVLDELVAARREFNAKHGSATTEERQKELRARFPSPHDYYARLLALAEANPDDPASVDALIWIVATSTSGYDAFKERGERIKRAMDRLAKAHLDDVRVGRLCLELVAGAAPLRDDFLHTVFTRSTDRGIKGRACLALGEFLLVKSETVASLKEPGGGERMGRVKADSPHRLPYYNQLLREDPEALSREGERLLELAIADYGDLPYDPTFSSDGGKHLADVARADLRRLRDLEVGQVAPEIDGKDVEGRRFRLSEYRGRVVFLTFSGNWCGPCRAKYPEERALVERLKGRPFALLSVNTDEDPETLRRAIDQGEITWPCWWESGVEGPICTQWAIQGFPHAVLIDHKGVIRSCGSFAESDVLAVVKACEEEPRDVIRPK